MFIDCSQKMPYFANRDVLTEQEVVSLANDKIIGIQTQTVDTDLTLTLTGALKLNVF